MAELASRTMKFARIEKIRERYGFTYVELGQIFGVHRSLFMKWQEKGEIPSTSHSLVELLENACEQMLEKSPSISPSAAGQLVLSSLLSPQDRLSPPEPSRLRRDYMKGKLSQLVALDSSSEKGRPLAHIQSLLTALGGLAELQSFIQEAVREELQVSGSRSVDTDPRSLKECPYCAEKIQKKAKLCRFCNQKLRLLER